jgi:hypothetical protein
VIGVALESGTAAEIRQAAERMDIPYPVLLGDRNTKATWDVSTLPTTVFIGPDGRVLGSYVGGMSQEKLTVELEQALGSAR